MIRLGLGLMLAGAALFGGCEMAAHGLGYEHRGVMANAVGNTDATALSPYGSDPQAVRPLRASIAFAKGYQS